MLSSVAMAGGTGLLLDARMLAHDPGRGHPERPERLRALVDHLDGAPGFARIGARVATEDEIARIHAPALVEAVAASSRYPCVAFDPDTMTSPGSYEAARLAVGGAIDLCDAVLDGAIRNGFACVRPPGHHAEQDRAMGFCFFNNVAIAAAHLRARGMERVLIVDWDLHHGNGTQHTFEGDPSVLYVSTHQYPYYPGTGAADEVGTAKGAGRTLNVPFPAGFGDQEFARAFDELILPMARAFGPDFVLVSAGFDCDHRDPLGGLQVTTSGFARMAHALCALAEETAQGRIVALLEGGYDLHAIVEGVDTTLAALRGVGRVPPPNTGDARRATRVIDAVRAAQAAYWPGLL